MVEASCSKNHQQRTRKTRTKSGCLTCRTRRKKCDERRPICKRCEKWQACCNWPDFHNTGLSIVIADVSSPSRIRDARNLKGLGIKVRDHEATQDANIEQCPDGDSIPRSPAMTICDAALSLSPSSSTLLEFFILEGSKGLSARTPSEDPFVRLALQLSLSDEVIKSGILAISGSRLYTKHASAPVEKAALQHHDDTIIKLRSAPDAWPPTTGEQVIAALTATVLLCHYEAMLGNAQDSLQSHLRACREMVRIARTHSSYQHNSAVYGILFEAYSYYSIQTIFRPVANELDIRANIEAQQFYQSLTAYRTFGYLMLAPQELYTLIPHVALFSLRMRGVSPDERPKTFDVVYHRLESRIRCPDSRYLQDPSAASAKVALIYQNCLLILLHAAYFSLDSERCTLQAVLRPIVTETLLLFETIKENLAAANAFWPMVIVGSCLNKEEDKDLLIGYFEDLSQHLIPSQLQQQTAKSGIAHRAVEALRWIWKHQEQYPFGPASLERFSEENGTGLCIG